MTLRRHCNHVDAVTATLFVNLLLLPMGSGAETIWIHASQAAELSGPIVFGEKAGVVEEGALGDFLVSTVCVREDKITGGYAEYHVKTPKTATYYVWARLRYPSGVDDSFAFIPQGETPTTHMSHCLGNSGVSVRKWHWDSRGSGLYCLPGTGRLSFALDEGDFTFCIYPREARNKYWYKPNARPARIIFNPRLNILCLATNRNYVPTDDDARHALKLEPPIDQKIPPANTKPLPFVSDEELARLGKKGIPEANEACLSDEQVEAVRQFVAAGGGLIATHETSLYDEKGNRRSDFGMADVFGVHYADMLQASARHVHIDASHPITKDLEALPDVVHDDTNVVVKTENAKRLATLTGKNLKAQSVPTLIVHEYGAGRAVYVPGRLDALQCERITPAIEQLFGNAVRWVAKDHVPVKITAPAPINVTLFDQSDRRILHLVNLNGDTQYNSVEVKPIENVSVELQIPADRRVSQLRRLWNKASIPFTQRNDRICFHLGRIGEYEIVAAELEAG